MNAIFVAKCAICNVAIHHDAQAFAVCWMCWMQANITSTVPQIFCHFFTTRDTDIRLRHVLFTKNTTFVLNRIRNPSPWKFSQQYFVVHFHSVPQAPTMHVTFTRGFQVTLFVYCPWYVTTLPQLVIVVVLRNELFAVNTTDMDMRSNKTNIKEQQEKPK